MIRKAPTEPRGLPNCPFEAGVVFVPSEVRIQGNKLIWSTSPLRYAVPRSSALDKFRRLHSEGSDKLLEFVKAFGVGWFCQHHLPSSHAQVLFGAQFGLKSCFPAPAQELGCFEESLEDYRYYSHAADAIVKAVGMVNAARLPDDDLLLRFAFKNRALDVDKIRFPKFLSSDGRTGVPTKVLLDSARIQIGEEVSSWIEVSQCRPELHWDHEQKRWLQRSGHSPLGILGAIALQLLAVVPQAPGWLVCDACAETYQAKRPAVPGRNHYCQDCRGTKEMWKFLKSQQRAKDKANYYNKILP
jgi:hypothetical protein